MENLSLTLYKMLYLIRRSEEYIIKHYPENDMKTPMHMSMGQEAIPTAVCHALGEGGQVYATYRSHATFLAKTGDTDQFFAELYGKVTGCSRGKAGSMHLVAPEKGHLSSSAVVASCIPVTVGTAFANQYKKNGKIACTFFGEGAVDEGVFWESLNIACLMKLPVMFVCEDNGLAVHTPTTARQGYNNVAEVVKKFNCAVFESDSTDVEVLHEVAHQAMNAIRKTSQPAFLHLKCYRYLEHVGIFDDFAVGYREKADFDEWHKRDCVALQRNKLLRNGMAEAELIRFEKQVDEQIEQSVRLAKAAPFPDAAELYQGVFHEKD